jgi:hypothetical protein
MHQLVRTTRRPGYRNYRQSPGRKQTVERLLCRRQTRRRFARPDTKKDHPQSATAHFPRIKLSHRASGEIPRICEPRLSRPLALGIYALKFGERNVNLATDFNHLRPDPARHVDELVSEPANLAYVRRDVITLDAVPARHRPHEFSSLECHTDRQPVEFRLHDVIEFGVTSRLHHARMK